MRKKMYIIILSLLCTLLVGCENAVIPNEEKIVLKIGDDFASYMPYEEIPFFEMNFEGILYTCENINKDYYTSFSNNSDEQLSKVLRVIFEKYKDKMTTELVEKIGASTTYLTKVDNSGKLYNDSVVPDDGYVYEETAWIALENGLKMTIDYRRFEYNGETYYTWRTKFPLTMFLYYPLMVINEDDTSKLLIISLPLNVNAKITPDLELKSLIRGKTYLYDPEKTSSLINYSFNYLDKFDTLDAKKAYVRQYYVDDMGGQVQEDGTIEYVYLGYKFKIVLDDLSFKMHYLGKAE